MYFYLLQRNISIFQDFGTTVRYSICPMISDSVFFGRNSLWLLFSYFNQRQGYICFAASFCRLCSATNLTHVQFLVLCVPAYFDPFLAAECTLFSKLDTTFFLTLCSVRVQTEAILHRALQSVWNYTGYFPACLQKKKTAFPFFQLFVMLFIYVGERSTYQLSKFWN